MREDEAIAVRAAWSWLVFRERRGIEEAAPARRRVRDDGASMRDAPRETRRPPRRGAPRCSGPSARASVSSDASETSVGRSCDDTTSEPTTPAIDERARGVAEACVDACRCDTRDRACRCDRSRRRARASSTDGRSIHGVVREALHGDQRSSSRRVRASVEAAAPKLARRSAPQKKKRHAAFERDVDLARARAVARRETEAAARFKHGAPRARLSSSQHREIARVLFGDHVARASRIVAQCARRRRMRSMSRRTCATLARRDTRMPRADRVQRAPRCRSGRVPSA